MMAVLEKAKLTVADYEALPDRDRYELIDGELAERDMSVDAAYAAGEIYARLREGCRAALNAIAFPDGTEYTLGADDLEQLRRPDASVVLKARLLGGSLYRPRFDFAPDFAVEVLSPNDVASKVDAKIADYLAAGTALVWLAKPQSRRIIAYRQDGTEISHGPDDMIDAAPVLPELRFRVGEVFPPSQPV